MCGASPSYGGLGGASQYESGTSGGQHFSSQQLAAAAYAGQAYQNPNGTLAGTVNNDANSAASLPLLYKFLRNHTLLFLYIYGEILYGCCLFCILTVLFLCAHYFFACIIMFCFDCLSCFFIFNHFFLVKA